jgi:hypothetical protein
MKRHTIIFISLLILLTSYVEAEVITVGGFYITYNGYDIYYNPTGLYGIIGVGSPRVELFDSISLLGNVGKTFWLYSNNDDVDYSTVVSLLSNNIEDTFFTGYRIPPIPNAGGTGSSDTKLIYHTGRDFFGETINCIGMNIKDASLKITPNKNGKQWTVKAVISLGFYIDYAPVPEPSSVLSLIFGFSTIGILRMKYRNGRRSNA